MKEEKKGPHKAQTPKPSETTKKPMEASKPGHNKPAAAPGKPGSTKPK